MLSLKNNNNNNFDLKVLNSKAKDSYAKNKMTPAPVGATFVEDDKGIYSPVEDPLNIAVQELIMSADDVEIMLVSAIGLVPNVGPILQGVYCRLGSQASGFDKSNIKSIIDQRMEVFKKDMNKIIDDKIEGLNRSIYKTISENSFNGIVNSSLELLMDELTVFKKKLEDGEEMRPGDSFLQGIRRKFDLFICDIKTLFPLLSDPEIVIYSYPQLIQILYLYVCCLENLMMFWHQYGFPPERSRGTPAIPGVVKEVLSFRKKIHTDLHRYLKVFQDNLKGNEPGLDAATGLLGFDPILYPIPVVCCTSGKSKNNYHEMALADAKVAPNPTITIDVDQKTTPFIYRIDGVSMVGNVYQESISARPRTVPESKDPVTGCYGFYSYPEGFINIKLSKEKAVSFRIFCSYEEKETCYLSFEKNKNEQWKEFTYESGSIRDPENQKKSIKSGFFISKKYTGLSKDFGVKIKMFGARILFLELVISDE
ncbi:hypothetical protein ACTA71_000086 [Dictyostelium dimigraforme]